MINFRYVQYYVLKFFPLAMSACTAAYLIYFGFIDQDTPIEELRTLHLAALTLASVGWFTVWMVEESLRKLMLASHMLIESVSKALEKSENEDRNEV